MSTPKKPAKSNEDAQAALQNLIAQGRKDGMIRAADLNAILEKTDLTPEKIEEVYDRFEAMNIQIISAELELDNDADLMLDVGLGDDLDLSGMETSEVVNMIGMFENCEALETVDLSHFDMSSVEFTDYMFRNCPAGSEWKQLQK